MIQALLAFCFYLALAAISLFVFWAVQIRWGDVTGLDPNNFLVRWFSKKKHIAMATGASAGMVGAPTSGGMFAIAVVPVINASAAREPWTIQARQPADDAWSQSPFVSVTQQV